MSERTIDLLGEGFLPPLPSAFLRGENLDLLAPLSFGNEADLPLVEHAGSDRAAVAAALRVANAAYGHPAADALASKLADPETAVVVTGQQPGLLGGPLYTLSKAVAATLWAERLEAQGRPAVAVFWVATEDHDFREVSSTTILSRDGAQDFGLGDDPSPLTPVGMRTLGPGMSTLIEELRELHPGDRWTSWIDRVAAWYRPDARMGEAFSRLIVDLLGERCPLMLDSMLAELKEAQGPWLRRIVEERSEIDEAFAEREQRIVASGFDLQVKPARGASPLFFLHGQARRRIEWIEDDRFTLRGAKEFSEPVSWLLEAIDENPAAVSPGVLCRSTLQDAILGTSVLVLGPGEVSYMPQVAPLYERLGIVAPRIALRPQILIAPSRQLEQAESLGIDLEQLLAAEFDLDRALAGGREHDLVNPVRRAVEDQLERLRELATEVDSNLASPWKKTNQQVNRALDAFTGRLTAAVARKSEADRGRLVALRELCRPSGGLQERALGTAYFPGKYGDGFVESLLDQMKLDPAALHVISPNNRPSEA